ncbi:hypothetical protein NLX83_39615 [Allokutzneria sp. A3M-2-11 16]|uniref:hypothetical protein n=1 Tax=Allokutzneria sp. A3M-2-11 16 TaxID=2962043 RepID=UPI0020B72DA8|nr:hypothetical protein [Allokutzneria sp. A3M-2-11 16]MCP3805393.1 hypothetical protein [Allokutzneria sp. A3M-2-11 16]
MTNQDHDDVVAVIIRTGPGGEVEALAAIRGPGSERLLDELGEGYQAHPVRVVSAQECVVIQRWRCRATVAEGAVTVAAPVRMRGAAVLVLPGDALPTIEKVLIDAEAGELDRTALGLDLHHVTAFGPSAQRAEELAREAAEKLRDGS